MNTNPTRYTIEIPTITLRVIYHFVLLLHGVLINTPLRTRMGKISDRLGIRPAIFDSFRGYNLKTFFNDGVAGLLVAIVAFPMSIAFAIQSGFSLQAGLISAIAGGFLIATMGGSRNSIGGPAAELLVITASYVANPDIGIAGMLIIRI